MSSSANGPHRRSRLRRCRVDTPRGDASREGLPRTSAFTRTRCPIEGEPERGRYPGVGVSGRPRTAHTLPSRSRMRRAARQVIQRQSRESRSMFRAERLHPRCNGVLDSSTVQHGTDPRRDDVARDDMRLANRVGDPAGRRVEQLLVGDQVTRVETDANASPRALRIVRKMSRRAAPTSRLWTTTPCRHRAQ